MNFLKISALMGLLLLPVSAAAQYRPYDYDYDNNNRDVRRTARQLANSANNLWNMVRNQPEYQNPERRYLYNQVRNFAQNARSYRTNPTDWQARRLVNQAENISRFVDRTELPYEFRNNWFMLEDQVELVSDNHGLSFDRDRRLARTDPFYNDRYDNDSGVFRWRGRVDGTDVIYLRGSRVDYRHMKAAPITNVSVDLGAPLPRRPVNVELRRIQGRGVVRIVEQPSPANNYAVGVMIEDEEAGADFYEFELRW